METSQYKVKLEEELKNLQDQLEEIGANAMGDWVPKEDALDIDKADSNEVADGITDYENNSALTNQLEPQFNAVKDALARIEAGTYGICSVCGEQIEEDRLEANPSATTCKAHM